MSRSFDFTRFVAIGCAVFAVFYALSLWRATTASGSEYGRHMTYSQPLRPAESSKMKGNPIARLRNDGRPFSLHVMPNRYSFETARLYPLARFVELLGRCIDRWCYVRYGSAVGWLSTDRFLKDPSGSPAFLPWMIEQRQAQNGRPATAIDIALPVRKGPVPPLRKVVEIALPLRRSSVLPAIPFAVISKSAQLEPFRIGQKNYALNELGGKVFLPVHEDHGESSRIVGTIPFFATNIETVGSCIDGWCLIRRGSVQGWIRQRHLTDRPFTGEPRLQLEAVMPVDALKIYSAPNKEAQLIANIEPPVTNIMPIQPCDEQWCHIRYSDIVGWVQPKYLTRQ
jgi:SH3-like domain-containing protein